MKKFILAVLFLSLFALPVWAYELTVTNSSDLVAAVANESVDTIYITNDISLDAELEVERSLKIIASSDTSPVLKYISGDEQCVISVTINSGMFLLDGFTITGGTNAGLALGVGPNASADIRNCTFTGNTSDSNGIIENYGGGMRVYLPGPVYITNCAFTNNTIDNRGGGICVTVFGYMKVDSCTFEGNTAEHGGGIHFASGASADIINCTFTNNTATGHGGALDFNTSDTVKIANCTFVNNSADYGAEIFNDESDDVSFGVANSIFWNTKDSYFTTGTPIALYNCAFASNAISGDSVQYITSYDCYSELDWAGRASTDVILGNVTHTVFFLESSDTELIDAGLTAAEIYEKLSFDVSESISIDQVAQVRLNIPDIGAVEFVPEPAPEPKPKPEDIPAKPTAESYTVSTDVSAYTTNVPAAGWTAVSIGITASDDSIPGTGDKFFVWLTAYISTAAEGDPYVTYIKTAGQLTLDVNDLYLADGVTKATIPAGSYTITYQSEDGKFVGGSTTPVQLAATSSSDTGEGDTPASPDSNTPSSSETSTPNLGSSGGGCGLGLSALGMLAALVVFSKTRRR